MRSFAVRLMTLVADGGIHPVNADGNRGRLRTFDKLYPP